MLAVLNFSHRDHALALNLLRWINELGGCKGHDLLLSYNRMAAEAGMHTEIFEEAKKAFDKVEGHAQSSEDERPWPVACNHAWREMVFLIASKVQKPWLWLEPDVTPLSPGWMDAIAAEYEKMGGGFMGCDVDVPGSRRHVSGIAVYPPNVMAACKRRFLNQLNAFPEPAKCEAWDMFFANEFLPHAKFTPLIQHIQHWPGYPDAPTFKESGPEIRSEAVLFHRVKDGSLIERLRRQRNGFNMALSDAKAAHEISVAVKDASVPLKSPETAALHARIAELEARLSGASASVPAKSGDGALEPSLKPTRRTLSKQEGKPDTRTPEQIQAAKDRMAKARAGRKAKA